MIAPSRRRRPLLVTWLAAVVLLLAVAHLAGLYAGIARREVFAPLTLSLSVWLLVALDGIWGLAWLVIALGLWFLRPWAHRTVWIALVLYQLTLIIQQVVFGRGAYERGLVPFKIAMAVLFSLFFYYVLTRRRIRQAFNPDAHHPQAEEPDVP